MQYSINLAFHFVKALVVYLFFMFKAHEHVSNQTRVNFYFSNLSAFLKSFVISSILSPFSKVLAKSE